MTGAPASRPCVTSTLALMCSRVEYADFSRAHTNISKAVNVNINDALRAIAVEILPTQTDLLPIFACIPRARIRHDYLPLKLAEKSSHSGNGMHSLPQEQSA